MIDLGRHAVIRRIERIERKVCIGRVDFEFPVPFRFRALPKEIRSKLFEAIPEATRKKTIATIEFLMTPAPIQSLLDKEDAHDYVRKLKILQHANLANLDDPRIQARALRLIAYLQAEADVFRYIRNLFRDDSPDALGRFMKRVQEARSRILNQTGALQEAILNYAGVIERLFEAVRLYAIPVSLVGEDSAHARQQLENWLERDDDARHTIYAAETILGEISLFKEKFLSTCKSLEDEMGQEWKLEDLPSLLVTGRTPEALLPRFADTAGRLFNRLHLWDAPRDEMTAARRKFIAASFELAQGEPLPDDVLNVALKEAGL